MSKKIKTTEENLLMFKLPNEWGFFTNLQHPVIAEEYSNFRKELKKPYYAPLDDSERHEFDCLMAHKYPSDWQYCQDIFYGGHYEGNRFIPSAVGLEGCTADSA